MNTCALLLCVCLAGCTSNKAGNQSAILGRIKSLRASHDLNGALKLVDQALPRDNASDDFHVRLRIAKSQIIREQKGLTNALAFINTAPEGATAQGAYLLRREQAALEADLGRFALADRHLTEAIAFAEKAKRPRSVASTEIDRSSVLVKLNRREEARECLNSVKRYGDSSGDHSWDAYMWKSTGRILCESNRFELAIGPLQAAYRKFLKDNQPQRAAEVTIDLGWAYHGLGQLDKAQLLYEECERGVPPADRHACLGHLGNIFYDRGDLARAATNYKKAAELAKNQNQDYYSNWLGSVALTLADEKKWSEAATYNSEALAIARATSGSIVLFQALVTAGRVSAGQRDYAGAERQLLQVESAPHADPAAVLDAYSALAKIYADTNSPEKAKQQFEAALKLVDGMRTTLREDENKLSYLASLMKLHQQYVAFLMKQGNIFGALQVSESSRARVLRDRVHLGGSTVTGQSIADYQRAARASGTAYLAYWVTPERSFLWAIDGASFTSYTLPGEARIRALVEQHQSMLEQNPAEKDAGKGASGELFDMVVRPALKALPKAKRFVIVPDGPLYGINFETLRSGSRYWVEDATLAVAPSLDLMLGKSVPRQSAPTALLVGDALEWTPEFPRLLNASKELTNIGHRFPNASQTLLAGAQATPAAFTKADPAKFSYIHFAAHAVPDRNSPLDSAIILSQGKLSVRDVLATPVRAQLVTISACSSAGARTYAGEGLVGLAWAFLRSGAHGVVAGLWDVNDYSSPILMEALYAGLLAGKQPADALRSAKLELLHGGKYADPYYWGAFQLYLGAR